MCNKQFQSASKRVVWGLYTAPTVRHRLQCGGATPHVLLDTHTPTIYSHDGGIGLGLRR
jgi:hypothetical protein